MKYLDSKSFLVDAEREDDRFQIWKYGSEYFSYQCMPNENVHTTICTWTSIDEMIHGLTWHEWILNGLKDERLRDKLKAEGIL